MDSSFHDLRVAKNRSVHNRISSRAVDITEQINREQEKLKKQHERLENEKRLNRQNSYIRQIRRHSLPSDGIILNITDKSRRSLPNIKNVKSRLFDFEKSAPRSRLQLKEDATCPSPSSPVNRVPMATHAMEVNKTTHKEIVNNIAVVPHIDKKQGYQRVDPKGNSLLGKTDLEKQATTRKSSLSLEQKDLGRLGARRSSLTVEHKVNFKKSSEDREYLLHRRDSVPRTSSPSTASMQAQPAPNQSSSETDNARLQELYNKAIETVQLVDESLLSAEEHPSTMQYKIKSKRRLSDVPYHERPFNSSGFDLATLRELESILSDARTYSNRKGASEDHVRLDLGSNRAQKKRIQHLEDVLKRLNPNSEKHKTVLDPEEILQCSYLRLSKSNVEALENMMKEKGKDPGIHVHSDVSTADIWKGMKEDRTDLKDNGKVKEITHQDKPEGQV